ncbi:MAG TPA: heavy metal translocating P-type ATPase, partial [Bacillota bacterium]|nr:heavy metal translocating P-type ATPase [Bacillota bacterium]
MRYSIEGLDCAHCAARIEQEIIRQEGLSDAAMNFAARTLSAPSGHEATIQAILDRIEPGAKLMPMKDLSAGAVEEDSTNGRRRWLPALAAAFFLIVGLFLEHTVTIDGLVYLPGSLYVISYLLVGWRVLRRAAEKLVRGQMLDEHFLMSIASLGAFAIGEWPEAAAVMVFYAVGERLQDMAVGRSRRSIAALLRVRPDVARLLRGDREIELHPEDVKVGELILVKPGERVPLDGVVSSGSSFLDTSPLTGESVPRRVAVGDDVMAGTINHQGVLTIRTSRPYGESSVARILRLVEEAGERKAPAEQFITSFARYYTPVVVAGAALVALLPPLIIPGASIQEWVYRALVLLVISCPCALVVSVPLTYFAGIGAASRQGILFKGANFVDAMATADTVIFDKTGTLTKGVFNVSEVVPAFGVSRDDLLSTAAVAEAHSNHPIAVSIRRAANMTVVSSAQDVREIAGQGILARLDGHEIAVGNETLLRAAGVNVFGASTCPTVVHVASHGHYLGHLGLSDQLRPDSRQSVDALRCLGVRRIFMLTGDRTEAAEATSTSLGLDGFRAGLLPEGKVSSMAELAGEQTIFVGDGINDAPVIAGANVGVA